MKSFEFYVFVTHALFGKIVKLGQMPFLIAG